MFKSWKSQLHKLHLNDIKLKNAHIKRAHPRDKGRIELTKQSSTQLYWNATGCLQESCCDDKIMGLYNDDGNVTG